MSSERGHDTSQPVRVHVTYGPNPIRDFERDFLPRIERELEASGSGYSLCADPEQADLVVFLESVERKSPRDAERLLAHPALRRHPERCFTLNYEDAPPGFLPGLYLSLPRHRFDPARHRSWGCVLGAPYECLEHRPYRHDHEPKLLFSFRGALSHPLRGRLLAQDYRCAEPFALRSLDRWLNYSARERADYATEMLDSWFVLCPRGRGCGTHRIFEAMSLGRCPVILSDDWVASDGLDWEGCTLRVAEADLARLPEILLAERPRAAELGQRAGQAWDRHFAPERRAVAALDQLRELAARRPASHDERRCQRVWRSREFRRENGWLPSQRAARRLRDWKGRLLRRA